MKLLVVFFLIFYSVFGFTKASPILKIAGKNALTESPLKIDISTSKKGTVVLFLSALCPCSHSHIKELKTLSKDYPSFVFIGVHSNTNESKKVTQDYFKKVALPFPILQDSNTKIANKLKAYKTPHAFIINPKGEIAYQGGVSSSNDFNKAQKKYLRNALDDLKNNKTVKKPRARTLGCTILRGQKNVW